MSNQTIGSIMIREIIRMKEMGFSMRKIARSIGKSRTTILKYVTNIEASDLSFKELLELTSEDIYELFGTPQSISSSNTDVIQKELLAFYPYVEKELKRVGVTRYILWDEYKQKHPQGVMYSRFCESYRQWSKKSDGYIPVSHKYGEKLFIDYAGKKLHIIDRQTGEIKPVEVFVGTLGASQYTYIEASFSQQIPDFITSVQNSFFFFGGVPACVIPDNLKSAVTKADKYEPFVNEQFARFSEHYNTSVMPTRSRKPKDKPLVEGAVNIAYTRIYASLRNTEFYGISELNAAIKVCLEVHNKSPFQKKEHSRWTLFHDNEKACLKPLAIEKYELRDYKTATVQKNCHVYYSPDKNYYSVPHTLIGKKIKLILTHSVVEIYHQQTRVAFHSRSRKAFDYVTLKEHLPVNHTYNLDWSSEYFINWATKIGVNTKESIEKILLQKQYPEQNYKSCMGILSMAKKVGNQRLDNACKRALLFDAVGYNPIKNILEKGLDKLEEQVKLFYTIPIQHDHIRGSEYYN